MTFSCFDVQSFYFLTDMLILWNGKEAGVAVMEEVTEVTEEDNDEEDNDDDDNMEETVVKAPLDLRPPRTPVPFAAYPPLVTSSDQVSNLVRYESPVSASAAREAGMAILAKANAVVASRKQSYQIHCGI